MIETVLVKLGIWLGEHFVTWIGALAQSVIRAKALHDKLQAAQTRVKESVAKARTRQEKINAARENARNTNNS